MIADTTMVSKGITLLAQTAIFNEDIREWRRQATDQKTEAKLNIFFHQYRCEQRKVATTAGKGVYTATVQNIYSVPPPSLEEHHEEIEDIQKIMQGMQEQSYDLEGLAQANAVLTRLNSVVMSQLSHITVTMNVIQTQLKTLASAQTNQSRPKIKHCFWSCGSNYTHGSKN